MKLSARQKKFLSLASDEFGFDPWDPPKGAPVLRNDEIGPLTDADLARFSQEFDVWITTPTGRALISKS